jgi:hypothetical protein
MEKMMDKTKLSSTVTIEKYKNMVNDQDKDGIANFLYERFSERYIIPLKNVPQSKKNGFIIMAVGCFMIETLESFQHGWPNTNDRILFNGERIGKGKAAFRYFFNRYEHFGDFKNYEDDFYKNIRCGILHQSETTNGWRILRSGPLFIKESKTINATKFLNRLDKCLKSYCDKLRRSEWDSEIWKNLRKKVNAICRNCNPK